MLLAPSTSTPNLGRIFLNLNSFEYWNNARVNGTEVKFDFGPLKAKYFDFYRQVA